MTKYLICTIRIENNIMKLYDGNRQEIDSNSTRSLNINYRRKRKIRTEDDESPVVWVLVGKNMPDEEVYLQVGQSKNLTRMLSNDIRKDVNELLDEKLNEESSKYKKLLGKYTQLEFYEIDLDAYDYEDFIEKNIPEDENLKKVYLTIRAAYVEGKIAAEKNCKEKNSEHGIWNPSPIGLDGYFYMYFKNKHIS